MPPVRRALADEAATAQLGADLALALKPGDTVALTGGLGAGKTALARALIRSLAEEPDLEVPSPTFTLVQSYATRPPVSHFDLYRLSSEDELEELGLEEALKEGVALVEWPERAGGRLPAAALTVELEHAGAGRIATICGGAPVLERVRRSLDIRDFLDRSGAAGARRAHLSGDASARSYETVSLPGRADRILMSSPPLVLGPPVRDGKAYAEIARSARSVHAFVALDHALAARGVRVPEIHAADLDEALLLIEHLGTEGLLDASGAPMPERYAAAAELLAEIHGQSWPARIEAPWGVPHEVPPFDHGVFTIETELLLDWYFPHATGQPATDALRGRFRQAWDAAFERLQSTETSLVLRDYHSPNIIWRPAAAGLERLGIIDFQDAILGPAAYDVASLALDARVDVPRDVERSTIEAYVEGRRRRGGFDRQAFEMAYAITAAQRNSKILGIFVRLKLRDGKPGYLAHLPRIRDYLGRVLPHPALAEVRELYVDQGIVEAGDA